MACEWIMDGISFQKIYGLCGLKGHSGDKRGCDACGRTDGRPRNVKIELEFWKQNSQYIIHNSKAYWPTLGPFRNPQGVPKGSIWPKTEPTWPKLTCGPYDALEGSKWP